LRETSEDLEKLQELLDASIEQAAEFLRSFCAHDRIAASRRAFVRIHASGTKVGGGGEVRAPRY